MLMLILSVMYCLIDEFENMVGFELYVLLCLVFLSSQNCYDEFKDKGYFAYSMRQLLMFVIRLLMC